MVLDEPAGKWSRPPEFGDGTAGLVSTADDLLAFARMLLRGGAPVLPPDAVRAMTTDQLTPAQKARGGLLSGFFHGRSWGFCQAVYDSGAFGWDGALGTSWLVDPSQDLTVIVLTQRMFENPDLTVAAVCCCRKIKMAGSPNRNRPVSWVGDTGIEPVTSSV